MTDQNNRLEKLAASRSAFRARSARWDLNIAILLFLVLIIVIILLFQEVDIIVVAPTAIFGLACAWLSG